MQIEQIYTGCLAQGAYYITSEGEAAIIDPLREVGPYLEKLKKDNVKLKFIFETHFHADFVSGHLSLSNRTNAPIVYGPTAEPEFDVIVAEDNQEFKVGNITIIALHTPGHTMESTTYLLRDENNKDVAIFSGDTLFLGDVGRPDLAQRGNELTTEMLAGKLYDSLRNKIMPLSDDITVYPGHGAGSACGKKMSKETVDTLGNQKRTNYALRADMTKEEFVHEVTDGISKPPAYFPMNVVMNKRGYDDIEDVIQKGLKVLDANKFEAAAEATEALVLDVRSPKDFAKGHIPKSINIGLKGQFAPWVGAMIQDVNQSILLVTNLGDETEAVKRLARVGFDKVIGILEGGFNAWLEAGKETDVVQTITTEEFVKIYNTQDVPVFDFRKDGEFISQHLPKAEHTPLSQLNQYLNKFPENQQFYIHCQGGYRSMIAASILKSRGIHNFIDISGGFKELANSGLASEVICPTTGEKQ